MCTYFSVLAKTIFFHKRFNDFWENHKNIVYHKIETSTTYTIAVSKVQQICTFKLILTPYSPFLIPGILAEAKTGPK